MEQAIKTTTIWPCTRCGRVWMFQPRVERPTCLKCDYEATHSLSAKEAQAQGVNVALAMHKHTDQLRRNRLARAVAFVGAMVKAMIEDWGSRLERWAREGARG